MKIKILEYIEQLEKSYNFYMGEYYKSLSKIQNPDYYNQGKADSVRATINDLNDILNNRTYSERLDKIL